MKPADVAAMFSVNPKTVARWSSAGLLQSIRTPGGHRRYRETDVVRLLNNRDDLPE
nr:BldC family transcriptional regulator [Gordonia araii]